MKGEFEKYTENFPNAYRHIRKATTVVVRVGIDYDNREVVKEARENGELPTENAGLLGYTWKPGYEKFILVSNKTGDEQLRVYPAPNQTPIVNYFVGPNLYPVEKKGYLHMMYAGEKEPRGGIDTPACFNISLRKIIEIG